MQSNENKTAKVPAAPNRELKIPPENWEPVGSTISDWATITDSEIGHRLFSAGAICHLIELSASGDQGKESLPDIATAALHIAWLLAPVPDMLVRVFRYNGAAE